jgi:hypothetical protein
MRSNIWGYDNCSKKGAERHIQIIKAYWKARGYTNIVFEVELAHTKHNDPIYCVRSNIEATWNRHKGNGRESKSPYLS